MQFPYTCTGSLSPTFVPARDVSLPVKRPYAFALCKAGYQSARGHLWKPPLRFWRRPPQSNCPPSSVHLIQVLGLRQRKGRISRTAPRRLASPLQSLRPILHIRCPSPVLSCSKGSRGLFVPSRVIGIRYSYGRRLPGLQFNASLAVTSPLNLPAPGRCQAVYLIFRVCTALCFC